MKKVLFSVAILAFGLGIVNAQTSNFLKKDFLSGYAVGENLEKQAYASGTTTDPIFLNTWCLSSNASNRGGVSPTIAAPLSYTGYIESGLNTSLIVEKQASGSTGRYTVYSLSESDTEYSLGTYYLAFILNVNAISGTPGSGISEFMGLDGNFRGGALRGRLAALNVDGSTYKLAIGGDGSAVAADFTSSAVYNVDQPYLLVFKAVIAGDGTATVSMFINPAITTAEPASNATVSVTGSLKALKGILLRSRTTVGYQIGGLRLSDTWANAVGSDTSGLNSIDVEAVSKNVSDIQYYDLTGKKVLNPAKGFFVKKTVYTDGTSKSEKIANR
ncbi:MAG: hypothetical protein ACK5MK_11025 [Dysgonomonas sp.]